MNIRILKLALALAFLLPALLLSGCNESNSKYAKYSESQLLTQYNYHKDSLKRQEQRLSDDAFLKRIVDGRNKRGRTTTIEEQREHYRQLMASKKQTIKELENALEELYDVSVTSTQ